MSLDQNPTPQPGERAPPVPVHVVCSDYEDHLDLHENTLSMKLYLNDELIQLNPDKVLQIMDIIRAHPADTSIKHSTGLTQEDRIQSKYALDENQTFLHSMVGDTNANKIKQIVDHTLTLVVGIILCVISLALLFILGEQSLLFIAYSLPLHCLALIPWMILKHLLFNKVAFKLCLQTFELWIKVSYGVMYGVAVLFHNHSHTGSFTLVYITDCTYMTCIVLFISYISSFDGVRSSKNKKLVASVGMASFFTLLAVESQFLMNDEDDYKKMIQLSNGVNVISAQSFMASSCRIIALFVWKQSWKTWRSKGRAVIISMSPQITWIDPTSNEQNIEKVIAAKKKDSVTQKVSEIDLKCNLHRPNDANSHDMESSESTAHVHHSCSSDT
eukprot:352012_1